MASPGDKEGSAQSPEEIRAVEPDGLMTSGEGQYVVSKRQEGAHTSRCCGN